MANGTHFVEEAAGGFSAPNPPSRSIDELPLSAFDDDLKRLFIPGGQILFRENEVADTLYVVITGCLGVVIRDKDGRETLIARIAAGETVGEMGLLEGGVRSATVKALRDTELVKLDKASWERLLKRNPKWLLALFSLLAKRLRDTTRASYTSPAIRTVAVVPSGLDINHHCLAHNLRETLARHGLRAVLFDNSSAHYSNAVFDEAESTNDMVLYCGEPAATPWTKRCLRQADRILLVASPASPFAAPPWLTDEMRKLRTPIDLAVLHDSRPNNGLDAVENLLGHLPVDLICRVRIGNANDHARLARLLRGKATTLVLSAGGARGFAHLGVVRALREAGVPIDLIGGCSMGSIVGAAVAMEWDDAEIKERLHSAFVKANPINDYTIPFLSLIKGAKVAQRLEQHFGGIRIEDLWRPFFCVSTNLTAGELSVHRKGPLAEALLASISIPGLLPPVIIGRDVHVDGGVMNWLPVDVTGARRGMIVAVDVASDPALISFEECRGSQFRQFLHCRRKFPPIVDLLLRAATVGSESLGKTARAHADILFKPPLESVDLLDWKACDRAIEVGYRHAVEKLEYLDKMRMNRQSQTSSAAWRVEI
jgi:NTE family protein